MGNDNIVRMALLDRCCGHLDEPRLRAKLIDGSRPTVAHTGPQTSHELEDEFGERALVRNTALDAFGNEFLTWRRLAIDPPGPGLLTVSFMRSLGHGPD